MADTATSGDDVTALTDKARDAAVPRKAMPYGQLQQCWCDLAPVVAFAGSAEALGAQAVRLVEVEHSQAPPALR
jgi:hypothetical protein